MMSPKNKVSSTQNVPVDILSNLPGDAIDAILLLLPLRDAVRTSILSKKWRYTWCTLPELTLCETDLSTTDSLANILYQILTLHHGPITKFSICFPYLERCPNIDNLIYFLSRNGIQHLVLELPLVGRYKLPSSIYTCSQMRHLSLHNCSIQLPPPPFRGFDWLIRLELGWNEISSTCLESLISRCPLLEQLVLKYVAFSSVIEINAPMLRSVDFTGYITSFCLKNSPRLEKLFLRDWDSYDVERKCDMAKFLKSFSSLTLLHLEYECLKFFAAGMCEVPTRLPFDLNCVERLSFNGVYLEELDVFSCVLCLIRSSPHLQFIEIEVYHGEDGVNIPALESLEVKGFSDVSFSHLKEVKLRHFVGSKLEMQLMKLLLAKSPMLVRMQIEVWLQKNQHESLYKVIFSVLNSFSRASPKAKVVIIVHYDDGSTLTFD